VLFFDLDRFKVVNDSLGHNVGDTLLVEVGKRLALCLRPGDTVARLGGDEFAVLLEDIRDKTDAADVAERVQRDLAVPFFIQGSEVMVSASIGIALKSDRYVAPDQILRDADIAMYQAKAKGKARYEFFDSTMHANVLDRLQLEADLRIAVGHRNGFVMHYQPILKLKRRTLTGFEALVRWQHPTRGLIAPLQFIPLAEETGLIIPLSEWTIETSCRQLREWQALYPSDPPLKMSINVSSRHFLYQGFAEKTIAIILENKIPAGSIALEITESIILENQELAIDTMQKLQDNGIHIHLDDFGTGYSSLSYLQRLPVNALKIDRSFVGKVASSEENREIVRTIISLAKNLNMMVIAEGVEEDDHLSEITGMDCHYAQGFLFGRPMTPEAVIGWIKDQNGNGHA
jgi:diguanylate cyclase (GGDEF)-like protein